MAAPDPSLAPLVEKLRAALGENLAACCVYGSAVRGNAVEGVSDINLLIVLERSDAVAHQAVAAVLAKHRQIDPLIVESRAFARTARCFASKFASIQRNHRVLHGRDPFTGVTIDLALERLLCEQGLRNLRLRSTYAFVMHSRERDFGEFLAENVSATFVLLSDVLRLSGRDVPKDFADRLPVMRATWSIDTAILEDLLALRARERKLKASEMADWHQRLSDVIDRVLGLIETEWTSVRGTP